MISTTVLAAALIGLNAVRGAPAPNNSSSTPACVNTFPRNSDTGAPLTTEPFDKKNGKEVNPPYYFNNEGLLAYDLSGAKHEVINAIFQTCTPNYAQDPNNGGNQQLYGRFFIPSLKKCLAVTNPNGPASYYVGTAECPTPAAMATRASIPFNFIAATEDFVDMRWVGDTIPSKNQFQSGCKPDGQLLVNATDYKTSDGVGEPNTMAGDKEDNRIHLYCPHDSGFNFLVVPTVVSS